MTIASEKLRDVKEILVDTRKLMEDVEWGYLYDQLETVAEKLENAIGSCEEDGVEDSASYHLDEFLKG